MYTHAQKKRGFSLVEVLVYLAVLILVVSVSISTYLSLNTVLLRNKTERTLTNAAHVALERVVRDIRNSSTVNTGLSTLGSSPGVLTLDSGTTTQFQLSGDSVAVSVNGTELGPLTGPNVTVDELIFYRYLGLTTELVRVKLTLSVSTKAASSTRTFYSSAVLRGSYE